MKASLFIIIVGVAQESSVWLVGCGLWCVVFYRTDCGATTPDLWMPFPLFPIVYGMNGFEWFMGVGSTF